MFDAEGNENKSGKLLKNERMNDGECEDKAGKKGD
jgi:hypothetical protein